MKTTPHILSYINQHGHWLVELFEGIVTVSDPRYRLTKHYTYDDIIQRAEQLDEEKETALVDMPTFQYTKPIYLLPKKRAKRQAPVYIIRRIAKAIQDM